MDGAYRDTVWSPHGEPTGRAIVSYNADLSAGEEANLTALQHLAFGDEARARQLFEQAAATASPAAAKTKIHLGRLLVREGDFAEARTLLVQGLQAQPASAAALAALGFIESQSGDPRLCAQYYRRAYALHPSTEMRLALAEAERRAELASAVNP